jgi:hypothetical protein
MNASNTQFIMSTQAIAGIFNFPSPEEGLNVGARPDAKFILNNRLGHLVFTVALLLLAVFTSITCLGKELTPISPSNAKLLEGRKLLIDEGGVVHVLITPAPAVILTNELLPLTFAFPTFEAEALEIAKFPHWGAIVSSEKALSDIVTLLEKSGLSKKAKDEIADIDSFVFTKDFKGYEYGEQVKKRDGGKFSVEFVALVSRSEDRGGELRVRRYFYNFDKDGLVQMQCYSEYDLLIGPALNWQTHQGSPPARVSMQTRSELVPKMLAMCGNLLPPGRKSKPDGKVEDTK